MAEREDRDAVHPSGKMIIAPSGSGKSVFIDVLRKRPGANSNLVDGDEVIANGPGWPTAPEWWLDENVASDFQKKERQAIIDYLEANPNEIILYNPMAAGFETDELQRYVIGAVIPDLMTHEFRAQRRAARREHMSDEKGGQRAFPAGRGMLASNRQHIRDVAEQAGVPISDTFTKGLMAARAADYGLVTTEKPIPEEGK